MEKPLQYKFWTKDEILLVYKYHLEGKSVRQIAILTNRQIGSISSTIVAVDMGLRNSPEEARNIVITKYKRGEVFLEAIDYIRQHPDLKEERPLPTIEYKYSTDWKTVEVTSFEDSIKVLDSLIEDIKQTIAIVITKGVREGIEKERLEFKKKEAELEKTAAKSKISSLINLIRTVGK